MAKNINERIFTSLFNYLFTDGEDSGTDDGDTTHPSHPSSGLSQKMPVGVVVGGDSQQSDHVKEERKEPNDILSERFHALSTGLLFSTCIPTPEMLAKLKHKKKVKIKNEKNIEPSQ